MLLEEYPYPRLSKLSYTDGLKLVQEIRAHRNEAIQRKKVRKASENKESKAKKVKGLSKEEYIAEMEKVFKEFEGAN